MLPGSGIAAGLRQAGRRLRPGLAGRLTLVLLPIVLAATLGLGAAIVAGSGRMIDGLITDKGWDLAGAFARSLDRRIARRLDMVDSLARLVRVERALGVPSRRRIVEWMRATSAAGPEDFGLWFIAAPDALGADNAYRGRDELGNPATGQFRAYFLHEGGTSLSLPAIADGAREMRYDLMRGNDGPGDTPPYRTMIGGRERLIVSIGMPVFQDGRFLGVAGSDFPIDLADRPVAQARPLGGRTLIVGPRGSWLYHPDTLRIGQPVSVAQDADTQLDAAQVAAIQGGLRLVADIVLDGEVYRRFVLPFGTGIPGSPVTVITDLPLDRLSAALRDLQYGVAGLAILLCTLLFLAIQISVARMIGGPLRRVTAALNTLEQSEAPAPMQESRRRDEIGSIARAIDRLRLSLLEQRRLRRDLDRMLVALENARDSVLLLDPEGRVVYANPAMASLAGVPPEALGSGVSLEDQLPPAMRDRGMRPGLPGAALARGRDWHGLLENWEIVPGRTVEAVDLSMTVLPQKDVLFLARDVSEARRADRERDELRAQLLHEDRLDALGRLTGGIAHEFNNMLGAVLGYAELLTADLDPSLPQHGFAGRIEQTALRARDLVRGLVAFARDDAVETGPLDLGAAVAEALPMLRVVARTGTGLTAEIEPGQPPVMGNEGQLVQLLMNLCLNARDAVDAARDDRRSAGGPAGQGAAVDGRIRLFAGSARHWHARLLRDGIADWPESMIGVPEPGRAYLVLAVRDHGTGIPEAEFGRIFDPFFTTKPRGKGSGLGLAMVFGILRSWQGHIRMRSALGAGTQLELYLPLADETALPSPGSATTGATVPAAAPARACRILVVDDEPDVGEVLRQILQRAGHRPVVVTDPRQALELLRRQPDGFDLLISDRNMPHIRGDDLLRQAQLLSPGLPGILCTGHAAGCDEAALREAGIAALFHKPVRAAALVEWIHRNLADSSGAGGSPVLPRG